MPTKKRSLTDSLSMRTAKARRKAQSHRTLHWIGGRAAATLLLGAALSVGGVTEAFQGVHFGAQDEALRIAHARDGRQQLIADRCVLRLQIKKRDVLQRRSLVRPLQFAHRVRMIYRQW